MIGWPTKPTPLTGRLMSNLSPKFWKQFNKEEFFTYFNDTQSKICEGKPGGTAEVLKPFVPIIYLLILIYNLGERLFKNIQLQFFLL